MKDIFEMLLYGLIAFLFVLIGLELASEIIKIFIL